MTRRAPLVSVIVPTKDRCGLLREALASVRALEGDDLRLEVIVADNGSVDDTAVVAAEHGAVLVRTDTPGAAAARNAGMRAATGDYLAFLDDDDIWLPGNLRPHLALLASRPELDAVVGQVQLADERLDWRSAPYPTSMPGDGDVFASFLSGYPQIGATVARASVRETVGEFDESLLGSQDWDWHLRLALRHRVGFVAVPSVLFRQRQTGTYDDLGWRRLGYFRRVFWSNARRAGARRPPPRALARMYIAHSGPFYLGFVQSAQLQAGRGDRAGARRALWRGLRASPLHFTRDALRPGPLWPALTAAFLPRR